LKLLPQETHAIEHLPYTFLGTVQACPETFVLRLELGETLRGQRGFLSYWSGTRILELRLGLNRAPTKDS
jgi:hypothetical protein